MFLVRLLAVILLATGIGCANRSSEAADLEIAEPPLDSLRAALRELVTHPSSLSANMSETRCYC